MKRRRSAPARPQRGGRLVAAGPQRGAPVGASGDAATGLRGAMSSDAPVCHEAVPEAASPSRHLTMSVRSNDLLRFLNEDRGRQKFCDVSVSVGGKMYRAHKVVLAHGSSYFHAKLSQNRALTHVTLDHVEDSIFQHLLGFLYASECAVAETDLPALTEAARFLDMMDILKMLCGQAEAPPARATRGEISQSHEVETSSSDIRAGAFRTQGPSEQSPLGKTSAKRQRDAQRQGASAEKEKTEGQGGAVTRRSARRRKTPTKYMREDAEDSDGAPEEKRASPSPYARCESGAGAAAAENHAPKVDTKADASKPAHGDDAADELEEEEEAGAMEEPAILLGSDGELAEGQDGHWSAAGTSKRSPVYPAGLAPVIIRTSRKKTLKCPICDKIFDRAGKYESHTRVHTGEKPFQCDVCFQRYSTKSNLTVHKKKHAGDAPFPNKEHKCPFCNKLHASRKTLAKHVRRFHPDNIEEFLANKKRKSEGWKCAICLKTFTRRPHLQEHMILHTQDRPFKCTFCDEYFKSRFARLKHHEKHHLGPFPCEICGRQFNDTGNRKRHMECTHGGKRKWTCFICGKSVRERTTLREHMRIHSGEKPYLCSICGQSFRHGSAYRLHLRVHYDDKRYECDECGKTFIRHDHLTKHQKIHSDEKAHQCEECGKCFRRHDHLTVHHKSVHLGEKVWQKYKTAVHQCEVCKKEFKGKSSLDMHFRTHSGEKPHRCPECHQTFRIKKTLTKHMVTHSDARPFNCPRCSATFKRKDKLKYHVDHVHSSRAAEPPADEDKAASVPPEGASEAACGEGEPKSARRGSPPEMSACVPVTLVPVHVALGAQGDLNASLSTQTHGVPQNAGYQAAPELAFLEKYALNPQPADMGHPVRPDQMLDPREQSYLGTLLELDSASSAQSIAHADQLAH